MFPHGLCSRTFYSAPFPEGRAWAGRVNTLVIFTITVAGLAHELQKERDLSAVFIGDPSSGPQNVIVQRQLMDQVPVRYQAGVGEANAGRYSGRVRAALARVRQRLAGLDADRQAIDAPRLGLADSLGSSTRLADNG
jgi:Nitrate and nitrite sensing